jgi:3-phenylpropionate/trans-cinnamate dioxygenase ferredoxin subunit
MTEADALVRAIPDGLVAIGAGAAQFEPVARLEDLPQGKMLRVTRGDQDVLLINGERGICAIADRCPHMSAPLSLGALDGCIVACPLHRGTFDLCDGSVVQFPTTGGLDADGDYHPPWTPADSSPKPEPTDLKAMARAATRVQRLRYYPLRIANGRIEVRLPR